MMTAGGWMIAFWAAVLLPVYSYLLYPLVIVAMSAAAQRFGRGARLTADLAAAQINLPVAVVVSAHNEEGHVADLVCNLQALQHAAPVRLYIGSDGSTDRTAEILQSLQGPQVRVYAYECNRGKASVLNDLLAEVTEPIVVFTDANTRLESVALQRLLRHFHDPRIGGVCGELVLRAAAGGDNVDGIYWRIERMLKSSENTFGALLGANGGIYAIRRECFVPIRPDTIVDDFCIAMTVVAGGRSLVYEPTARAIEDMPAQIRDEFKRRVRIGIGNYQAFFRHPEFLLKTHAMVVFAYVSHKVLRWFTPHLLVLAFVASAVLSDRAVYRVLWWTQLLGYASCAILYWLGGRLTVPRLLRLPVFLAAMNLAFGVGFYRYVSGQYSGTWKRTVRA